MVKQTYVLLRCTTLKYAKSFLNTGNLRFGKPIEWIKEANINGEGRGDNLEGSFASCEESNSLFINEINNNNDNLICTVHSNRCYFQRKNVLDLRTYCLFGVNDDMFTNSEWNTLHQKCPTGIVTLNYFKDFYNNVSEQDYNSLPDEKKPVVIMINNPHMFFERIRGYFKKHFNIEPIDILISPVKYIDEKSNFIIGSNPPYELFFKDERFSNQREIRIVLNICDPDVIDKIEKCNGIFNIGSMDDIAEIFDYYFHDLPMQLSDNALYFELPKPGVLNSPEQCIAEIMFALADEIPHCNTIDETNKYIAEVCNILETDFGYKCDCEKYTFTELSTGNVLSPDWKHISSVLDSHAYNHYMADDFVKALDLYSRAIMYSPTNAQYWFNRSCCHCKLQNKKQAISDMKKAVELCPENEQYKTELDSLMNLFQC